MPSWQHHRARVASLSRDRAPNDPEILAERQAMQAERLAEHVARVVAQAPPLTPEQRDKIANLLRAGGDPPAPRTSLNPPGLETVAAKGTGSTLRPTASPQPEPDGRTGYRDPTGNADVKRAMRGGRG